VNLKRLRLPDSSLASMEAYNWANTLFRMGEGKSQVSHLKGLLLGGINCYLHEAIDLNPDFEKSETKCRDSAA
jgi:hypothetical protein